MPGTHYDAEQHDNTFFFFMYKLILFIPFKKEEEEKKTAEGLKAAVAALVSLLTYEFAKMGERRTAHVLHVLVRLGNWT